MLSSAINNKRTDWGARVTAFLQLPAISASIAAARRHSLKRARPRLEDFWCGFLFIGCVMLFLRPVFGGEHNTNIDFVRGDGRVWFGAHFGSCNVVQLQLPPSIAWCNVYKPSPLRHVDWRNWGSKLHWIAERTGLKSLRCGTSIWRRRSTLELQPCLRSIGTVFCRLSHAFLP